MGNEGHLGSILLLRDAYNVNISHVFREANQAADWLAKHDERECHGKLQLSDATKSSQGPIFHGQRGFICHSL